MNFLKNNNYFKSGSRYGLAGAAFFIVAFILLFVLGENPLISNKYLDFLLIPLFVFFGVKELRDYRNGGILHFWEGMTTGFFVYIIAALITAGFILIFLEIQPPLLQDYIDYSLQLMQDRKENIIDRMGEDTYHTGLDQVRGSASIDMAMDDLIRKILIGFAINVIITIVMRRQRW